MKNKNIKKILYWGFILVIVLLLIGTMTGILPDPLVSNRISVTEVILAMILIVAFLIGQFLKFWDKL